MYSIIFLIVPIPNFLMLYYILIPKVLNFGLKSCYFYYRNVSNNLSWPPTSCIKTPTSCFQDPVRIKSLLTMPYIAPPVLKMKLYKKLRKSKNLWTVQTLDSEYHVYLGIINAFVEYDGGTCTAEHGVHGGLRLRLAQTLANILPVVFYGVSTRPYLTNVRTVKELRNAEMINTELCLSSFTQFDAQLMCCFRLLLTCKRSECPTYDTNSVFHHILKFSKDVTVMVILECYRDLDRYKYECDRLRMSLIYSS
ncbi:hypothetical protein HW555_010666 [Spodoptera exigua]|uniref:Uncharacterized protein n=1 Tax=Spodoptera exigua TaxID=7107 RepID=A0A835L2D1_SPOEX|nr:hypothetical protein HW555_010666 [Spodoptera exigua]